MNNFSFNSFPLILDPSKPILYTDQEIEKTVNEARSQLDLYSQSKDPCYLRRVDTYRTIHRDLELLKKNIETHNKFWHRFYGFFCYLPPAVRKLHETARLADHLLQISKIKEARISLKNIQFHYPETTPMNHLKRSFQEIAENTPLKSSELAGDLFSVSAQNLYERLVQFSQEKGSIFTFSQKKQLEEAIQKFMQIKKIFKKLDVVRFIHFEQNSLQEIGYKAGPKYEERSILNLGYWLSKKITRLGINQKILIPAGYLNENTGHGVLYEIKKKRSGNVITVINTGEGLGRFDEPFRYLFRLITNRFCDYKVTKLPLERVANLNFLRAIIKKIVKPIEKSKEKEIYQPLAEFICDDQHKIIDGRGRKMQVNSICGFACLKGWLESNLDAELFQSFEIFLSEKGLEDLEFLMKDPTKFKELKIQQGWFGKYQGLEALKHLKKIGEETLVNRRGN